MRAASRPSFSQPTCALRASDSLILSDGALVADLQRVMGDAAPKNLSLLYRGSRDGFNAAAFHAKCDGRGATLTVIGSKKGNVFGGYTSMPWASAGNHKQDASAYIFSLRGPRAPPGAPLRMNSKGGPYQGVCHDGSYGPFFPGGNDLIVYNDMKAETGKSYSNLGGGYALVRVRALLAVLVHANLVRGAGTRLRRGRDPRRGHAGWPEVLRRGRDRSVQRGVTAHARTRWLATAFVKPPKHVEQPGWPRSVRCELFLFSRSSLYRSREAAPDVQTARTAARTRGEGPAIAIGSGSGA